MSFSEERPSLRLRWVAMLVGLLSLLVGPTGAARAQSGGPRIVGAPAEVRPGEVIQIEAVGIEGEAVLRLGSRRFSAGAAAQGIAALTLRVPWEVQAGFLPLSVTGAEGAGSDPVIVRVRPDSPFREIRGTAVYEKLPVTAAGLMTTLPAPTPIRDAELEVLNPSDGEVFSVGRTDLEGRFRALVPMEGGYRIRVQSRSASSGTAVVDHRSGRLYAVEVAVPSGDPHEIMAGLDSGVAGAFNILEAMRRGDAFVRRLEPHDPPPALSIYWTPGVTVEAVAYFDEVRGAASVPGDRSVDSDEFDDAVLLHEYAHMIGPVFSRDDSIGGPHHPGDVLDPRVAWSEGWANFFSAAVRRDPVYRDSYGPGGSLVMEYNLAEDLPSTDGGGYWSEAAVQSLLWELWDGGDALPFEAIWDAFRAVAEDAFVYLPSFLDRLVERAPDQAARVAEGARLRAIDYSPRSAPSVSNPFPRIVSGAAVRGSLDSWTSKRRNLARSAHLYRFSISGGAVGIRLEITGLGPARNPMANDLSLVLMDAGGRLLAESNSGADGDPEWIATFLPAGDYVVEVRSFHRVGSANPWEFNSGAYRLVLSAPSN